MQGLLLGIDLCDDCSQISFFNTKNLEAESVGMSEDDSQCLIPTVLCKRKGNESWYIGEDAYRYALMGEGIMVDKLISLAAKGGTSTMEGTKYEAEQMLELFIGRLLMIPLTKYKTAEIEELVFTIQTLDPVVMDTLIRIADRLGVKRDRVHIISHTESFLYYVISQQKELWRNQSCLFDLTETGLHYYELRVIRGRSPQIVEVAHQELEEAFSLEILETKSGGKLADTILCSCAERLLNKKLMSSVFLTGRGFETNDWASGFLKFICNKRRVFAGQNLFAKGAAYIAFDNTLESTSYPYICICEGRIRYTVSMEAVCAGRNRQMIVAGAGTNWYEAKADIEFILDNKDSVDFTVTPADNPRQTKLSVPLKEFPVRPAKATRIEMIVAFIKEDCMMVRLIDKGFGDLFPSSGQEIKRYFYLNN